MKTLIKKCALIPEWIGVVIVYLAIHLPSLTLLPVFADEAIYIRWAQLVQDDLARYAFFSMADGKPPLFMWFLAIVLHWFHDPLLAGRFLAVLIGLVTVFVMRALVREFNTEILPKIAVTLVTIFLPFWFFYHRMALMDGLLTLFLAFSFLFAMRLSKPKTKTYKLRNLAFLALSFGAAMMTKTPALFAIPIIAITPIFVWLTSARKRNTRELMRALLWVGLGGVLGCLIFLSLRVSPLFGALFTRSNDFTFTLQNLVAGEWKYVIVKSLPRNVEWIIAYVTPELFVISFFGLFNKKYRTKTLFLLICAACFFLPLTLVGRVLWPRYFLPSLIFVTLAIGLGIAASVRNKILKIVCVVLLVLATFRIVRFLWANLTNVASIPFVEDDRLQYLADWSAGFGNAQVRDFIVREQAKLPSDGTRKIIVLTEGSFGTLPDGLLMYFHDNNAQGLEIHGIGVAVSTIPTKYIDLAKTDDVYYMLNSHRFGLVDKSILKLIFEVKRPSPPGGPVSPSLLFYKIM